MKASAWFGLLPRWLKRPLKVAISRVFDIYSVKSYSQEGEDMILRRIFEGQSSGFYVDVGAHHPRRFSNTCFFYQRGWRGINIEPNPDALRTFDRERMRDTNLGIGIAERTSTLTYHLFDEPALNTFDAALAARRVETTGYREVATIVVPVARLEAVLDEHLPIDATIDFLNVDVEGFDLEVLRTNNWERYRPRLVLAEALEVSLKSLSSNEIYGFMLERDYALCAKTFNTLFFCDSRRNSSVNSAAARNLEFA